MQIGFSFPPSGFIFSQWLYFPMDFGCVFIISFPLFTSIHLIFHNYVSMIFLHYLSIPHFCYEDFNEILDGQQISFKEILFSLFLGLLNSLFTFKWHGMHPIKCTSMSDKYTEPSIPNTLAGLCHLLQFCLL